MRQYMMCVDAENTKLLEKFETYLCDTSTLNGSCHVYGVPDNKYLGIYRSDRFSSSINGGNKEVLDYGIEKLQEKVKQYEKKKQEAKVLKAEINSIYKQVGKQLKLNI